MQNPIAAAGPAQQGSRIVIVPSRCLGEKEFCKTVLQKDSGKVRIRTGKNFLRCRSCTIGSLYIYPPYPPGAHLARCSDPGNGPDSIF